MSDQNTIPAGVDHLLYGVPHLEEGMDLVERALGIRPVRGGRHPHCGTHNAILSLGSTTYLEVIAPDPELPPPERGIAFGVAGLDAPRLVTWALRCERIEDTAAKARAAGVDLGDVETGGRDQPGGRVLSWKVTDPYALPLGGAIPFLISWGDTPHPATVAPRGATLVGLESSTTSPIASRTCCLCWVSTWSCGKPRRPRWWRTSRHPRA